MNNKASKVYENYKITNKFLGIISYKNLIIILIYLFTIFKVLEFINITLIYKSYIVIILFIPIFVGVIINVNGDNILDTIKILFKFYMNRKLYINDYKNINIFLKNKDKKIL